MRFSLNLEDLYTVVDSANYNRSNKFCPVLLKVGPKMVPDDTAHAEKYLLQVWSNEGEMIFEKELNQKVKCWNIYGDNFFWQERDNLNVIYLLQCVAKNDHSKLFKFQIDEIVPLDYR